MPEETKIEEVAPATTTPAGITEVVNDTPNPAQKKVMTLKVTFYEQDQGNQNMFHWLEVECPHCQNKHQFVTWRNLAMESVRALICPCGKKLFSEPTPVEDLIRAGEKITSRESAERALKFLKDVDEA